MRDIEFETVLIFFYDDVYLPWLKTNIKTGIWFNVATYLE